MNEEPEKILQKYQSDNHVLFRDQNQARELIKLAFQAGRASAVSDLEAIKQRYEIHTDEIHCTCLKAALNELKGLEK